jgi:hypothetical protein
MKRELAKIMAEVGEEKYLNFQSDLGYNETNLSLDGVQQQCAAPSTVAMPYSFTITNSAGSLANAILFGANIYMGTSNYGSDAGITITPANSITYYQFLQNSKDHPFEFKTGRLTCSVTTQLDQSMTATYTDVNGSVYTKPLSLSVSRNSFQTQSDMVDFEFASKVDGNMYLRIPIIGTSGGTTTAVITFFPNKIFDAGQTFVGASATRIFNDPIISGQVTIQRQVSNPSAQWPTVVTAGMGKG